MKRTAIFIGNGLVGLLFGVLAVMALSPALASFPSVYWLTWVILLCVIAVCAVAPTIRRGFGRGFLTSGAALFALPLSGFLLSSVAFNEVVGAAAPADAAFTAIGAGAAAGAVTIFAGFVGFVLGSLFLIIGLVLSLGGRREVYVLQKHSGENGRSEPTLSRPD